PFSLSREQDVDDGKKISTLLTGVIDLAFKEPDGWVIVDYKTGGKRAEEVEKLAQHYRSQIGLYSESWEYITGFSVKEKGFYFVDLGLYVTVD
ncbi:MAG: PD-(D/E)XK nuclease family protein, partial [bacterium]